METETLELEPLMFRLVVNGYGVYITRYDNHWNLLDGWVAVRNHEWYLNKSGEWIYKVYDLFGSAAEAARCARTFPPKK